MREDSGTIEKETFIVTSLGGLHSFSTGFYKWHQRLSEVSVCQPVNLTPARKMTTTNAEMYLLDVKTRHSNSLLDCLKYSVIIFLVLCAALCLSHQHLHDLSIITAIARKKFREHHPNFEDEKTEAQGGYVPCT